jgi:hypothetical protein
MTARSDLWCPVLIFQAHRTIHHAEAQKFLQQKERGITRVHQNVVLVITPSPAGCMPERFTM